MFRDILLAIPKRWVGASPSPGTGPFPPPVEHALRRGFQAPVGRLGFCTSAQKKADRSGQLSHLGECFSRGESLHLTDAKNIKYEKQRFYKNYYVRKAAGGRMLTYLSVENIPSAASPPYTPSQRHPAPVPISLARGQCRIRTWPNHILPTKLSRAGSTHDARRSDLGHALPRTQWPDSSLS